MGVVIAVEPGHGPVDTVRPAVIFDMGRGPSAGVRQRGDFDRLLVEGGAWVTGRRSRPRA